MSIQKSIELVEKQLGVNPENLRHTGILMLLRDVLKSLQEPEDDIVLRLVREREATAEYINSRIEKFSEKNFEGRLCNVEAFEDRLVSVEDRLTAQEKTTVSKVIGSGVWNNLESENDRIPHCTKCGSILNKAVIDNKGGCPSCEWRDDIEDRINEPEKWMNYLDPEPKEPSSVSECKQTYYCEYCEKYNCGCNLMEPKPTPTPENSSECPICLDGKASSKENCKCSKKPSVEKCDTITISLEHAQRWLSDSSNPAKIAWMLKEVQEGIEKLALSKEWK